MKPHELAEITKKAIAKRNKEKPAAILAEIRTRMETDAESGEDHTSYCFADEPEIVEQVLDTLRDEGFTIKEKDGPKKNITRISWAKAAEPKVCGFLVAWVGTCKQKAGPDGVCDEHRKVKCRCGKQAIRECDTTMGPFVCGFPTCGRCTHSH